MLGRKLGIMAFIYVITNNINGKQYVGKTNDSIEKRFKEHISDSRRERCEKRPLYSAMNKYGVEHFSIEELEECSSEEAPTREAYWIDKLNTYHYGYNATRGGDGKQLYNYKKIADKYLQLQSMQKTAQFFHCDLFTVKTACLNEGVSLLTRKEIAAREKYNKPLVSVSKETGEKSYFFSISEAAHWIVDNNYAKTKNISSIKQKISLSCQGKRQSAFGFYWMFDTSISVTT